MDNSDIPAKNTPPEPFVINRETYASSVARVYESPQMDEGFSPKTLIQFGVVLPFHVPATEDATYTFDDDVEGANSYHFSTLLLPHYIPSGAYAEEKMYSQQKAYSRVEMVHATPEHVELPDDRTDLLSIYFDRLLTKLGQLLVGYLIFSKDTDAHRVVRDMLQPTCLYRIVRLDDPSPWDTAIMGLFLLHYNVPYMRDALTHEQVAQSFVFGQALASEDNPFILSEELMLDAKRYLKNGFYRESVLFAQMSVENFLNTLFVQLLLHEGKTQAEAETELENTAFKTRVEKQFHPRLGGKWNLSDARTQAGQWWRDTYVLRNRIAHGNYFPVLEEVENAIGAAIDFRVYLVELLHGKKKKYRHLAELIRVAKKQRS